MRVLGAWRVACSSGWLACDRLNTHEICGPPMRYDQVCTPVCPSPELQRSCSRGAKVCKMSIEGHQTNHCQDSIHV